MLLVLFGSLIGLSLGLTGAGGSILAVPLLIYGAGVAPHEAIRISLLVVAATAAIGAVNALRSGAASLRAGLIFAATGVLAAPVGIAMGSRIEAHVLLSAFAVLTLIVSTNMWRKASTSPDDTRVVRSNVLLTGQDSGPVCRLSESGQLRLSAPCTAVLALCGLLAGTLSGLFGVGGGFLIVPMLMFVTQMSIHGAVGTSLLVITLIGASGATAGVLQGGLDWQLVAPFLIGGAAGILLGRLAAGRLAGPMLQKIFAASVFLIGTAMLIQQMTGVQV